MDVGQAPLTPWTWQPCENSALQPHWMTLGTSAQTEPESMPFGPIAACYLSCVPGPSHQAEPDPARPLVPALTREEDSGTLPIASHRPRKAHASSAIQARPSNSHISTAEWAVRRHEITELYRFRGWTLPRVMEEMSRRGFHASSVPSSSHSY